MLIGISEIEVGIGSRAKEVMMNEMTLQSAYELMREAVGSGEHERLAGIARHVLSVFPQNLKAKLYLGEALIAGNALAEARELFEEVCDSDPENIVAQVGLSTVAEREGDLAAATKYLERAMEIRPDMGELRPRLLNLYQRTARHDVYLHLSRSGLARLFMRSHAYSQAIPEFHQMALANPNHREHVVALAEALWRNGDETEAHEICQEVLLQAPQLLKANLIEARYQSSRDSVVSNKCWERAQALDPLLETADELFGSDAVPAQLEWVLPAWDDTAWYQQQVQSKASSGVRVTYLVTAEMPTVAAHEVESVLGQMRQMGRMTDIDHDHDCACMIDDTAHDSTGILLQRTLQRQAALHADSSVATLPVATTAEASVVTNSSVMALAANFTSAVTAVAPVINASMIQTMALDPHMLGDGPPPPVSTVTVNNNVRIPTTMPVAPDVDEVATEPVQLYGSGGSLTAVPFDIDHPVDDDDRFLATVMQKNPADVVNTAEPSAIDTPVVNISRIDTTMIQTTPCSDDLYVLLARLEIKYHPAQTEDLRDVVARTLGGAHVIDRTRTPVNRNTQMANQAAKAAAMTLESLLDVQTPDYESAIPLSDSAPGGDNLLASLLAQPGSGLTEGMRGLSATLPRVDSNTRITPVETDETLTELLEHGLRKGSVAADDVARASAGDQSTHDALLALLEDESVVVQRQPDFSQLSVSHGMRLHDFPADTQPNEIDVSQVIRDLGLTSGEMTAITPDLEQMLVSEIPPVVAPKVSTPLANLVPPVDTASAAISGNLAIDGYLRALQEDPENAVLRLSVARVAIQCRMYDTALTQYRYLIRNSVLLEDVVNDLRDVLAEIGEPQIRRECSRLLGNAYAKQNKVQEAVEAYRMTLNSGPAPLL